MHQIIYKGKRYAMAAGWAECPAGLLGLAALARATRLPEDRVRFTIAALEGRRRLVRLMEPARLVEATQWIFDETPDLSKATHITVGRKLLLPAADLSNVSLIEFILADEAFRSYVKGRDTAELLRFLSLVARPSKKKAEIASADWDGDARVPVNTAHAERQAKALRHMSAEQAALVLLLWEQGLERLQKTFAALYARARQSEGSMMELAYDLAGQGTFGSFEQVCKTPVYTVFLHLFYAKKQAEASRKKQP